MDLEEDSDRTVRIGVVSSGVAPTVPGRALPLDADLDDAVLVRLRDSAGIVPSVVPTTGEDELFFLPVVGPAAPDPALLFLLPVSFRLLPGGDTDAVLPLLPRTVDVTGVVLSVVGLNMLFVAPLPRLPVEAEVVLPPVLDLRRVGFVSSSGSPLDVWLSRNLFRLGGIAALFPPLRAISSFANRIFSLIMAPASPLARLVISAI